MVSLPETLRYMGEKAKPLLSLSPELDVTCSLLRTPCRRSSLLSSSKKDPVSSVSPVSMTEIKGFKAQKVILRYNLLPKMQVDAQLGAQQQNR